MKARSDFQTAELYKEYLMIHFSESFMKSLLSCHPDKPLEYFTSEVAMYEFYAKRSVRYAKALVDELKIK